MSLKILESKIGYKFKNIELLDLATAHKSSNNTINNERLEFLGDSILNSIISRYLFLNFPNENKITNKQPNTALDISNNGAPINCSTLNAPLRIKKQAERTPVKYVILFIILV